MKNMTPEGFSPYSFEKNSRQVVRRRLLAGVAAVALAFPVTACSSDAEQGTSASSSPAAIASATESPNTSVSPTPIETTASPETSGVVSKEVLSVIPRVGLLTYKIENGQESVPYASGVVIGEHQFLTSADLFGPRSKDPNALCGDYKGTRYNYAITTKTGPHHVTEVRRHPDPNVNLAVITVEEGFKIDGMPEPSFAAGQSAGPITVLNFQGGTRLPETTGPAVFAGHVAPGVTPVSVQNPYYGAHVWKVSLVATPGEQGFNSQTGLPDKTQEGYAQKIGSGGPIVSPDGTIAGVQTAITEDKINSTFLATLVTEEDIKKLLAASAQSC